MRVRNIVAVKREQNLGQWFLLTRPRSSPLWDIGLKVSTSPHRCRGHWYCPDPGAGTYTAPGHIRGETLMMMTTGLRDNRQRRIVRTQSSLRVWEYTGRCPEYSSSGANELYPPLPLSGRAKPVCRDTAYGACCCCCCRGHDRVVISTRCLCLRIPTLCDIYTVLYLRISRLCDIYGYLVSKISTDI